MGQFIDQKQKEVEFFGLFQEMKNLLAVAEMQLSCYQRSLPDSKQYDNTAGCISSLRGQITQTLEKITLL